MRVLLTSTDADPTSDTILVLPQDGTGDNFETLTGDRFAAGFAAEADNALLTEAVNASARQRADEGVRAEGLAADVRWLHKALADCEPGSKIALKVERGGYVLDDSQATRIDRAKGLRVGDRVAIGPAVAARKKILVNAHGKALAIDGKQVEVEIDAGDRDRLERATGETVRETETFHIGFLEKLD